MATYNKPDWKERAKSLIENDFFIEFEEPTTEADPPSEPAEQSNWDHDFDVEEAGEDYIEESVEKPDNAVVDCKVNTVIAHCEDEKPVDCKGEKEPLKKPLTEKSEKKTFKVSYRENGVSKSFTVEARNKAEAEKLAWSQVDVDDIYVEEV